MAQTWQRIETRYHLKKLSRDDARFIAQVAELTTVRLAPILNGTITSTMPLSTSEKERPPGIGLNPTGFVVHLDYEAELL